MGRVEGKVALITGGASGIGAEAARVLAREGARVVISDVQEDLGRHTAAKIPGAVFLRHDVRSEQEWRAVIAEVMRRFGRLDVLVNNAGLVRFATIEEMSYEDYRLQVDVMLDGTFLGCKTALPHMTKGGGGSIINVASLSALRASNVVPAYAAAKGGVVALTRSVATHCKARNYSIRCNAIAPGMVETPMTAQAVAQVSADNKGMKHQRERGMGKPVDVANAVLYLASEESRLMSGTVLVLDNGETAG